MQTMIEKLELIAQCLRDGVEIQFENGDSEWKESSVNNGARASTTVWSDHQYRAKPVKPRVIHLNNWIEHRDIEGNWIDLDNEQVMQALKDAGVEI
jgi:hypothetical protein